MLVFLAFACCLLGCDGGWKDYSESIDRVTQHTTELFHLDSVRMPFPWDQPAK